MLEDFAAVHAQMPRRPGRGHATVRIQKIVEAAVGENLGVQDAAIGAGALAFGGGDHDGAGAVAEEDAGAAVFPIEDARHGFGADDERGLGLAAADEIVGDGEAINEARADRLNVEGRAARHTEAGLNLGRGRRESLVGRRRGDDDDVDIVGFHAGIIERASRGFKGEIGGGFAFARDMAALDAGARHDPGIGGVDHLGQIVIGENLVRQMGAAADNDGTRDGHETAA